MAVDTENKRRSVIFCLPIPNNDIGFGDRRQTVWLYRSILPIVLSGGTWTLLTRGGTWTIPSRVTTWTVPSRTTTWTLVARI